MSTISVREVAAKLRIAWRTARSRLLSGAIPGLRRHKGARRGWEVDRQVFEKWLVS